jgi:flagellar hook protein FlgE
MANSLLTGISGLRSHQKMLEVVGNNLANMNTTAFKASRTLFADLMYELQRGAASSSTGNVGSVNPIQVGTGSRVAMIDRQFAQGNLEATGQELDFAMDGLGYFVVASSSDTFYSRAGSFGLDEAGYLVDPSTGNFVQRFGSVGEPSGTGPSFQTSGDNRIFVPIGSALPGEVSSAVAASGNLSSRATGPVAQTIRTLAAFTTGGGTAATASTLLNDLDSNAVDYVAGDALAISGNDHDGSGPAITSLSVDGTTTVQQLIDALNTAFPLSSFSIDASGNLSALASATGPSQLAATIEDSNSNAGSTDYQSHAFGVTATGKDGDQVLSSAQVFDSLGGEHTVQLQFTKQADATWTMEALVDPSVGTIVDGLVEGITFNSADGSFSHVAGTGAGDDLITVQFTGVAAQTMQMDFGTAGSFTGLVAQGGRSSIGASADGHESGTLRGVQADSDGIIYGVGSNGVVVPMAQMAIASFRNQDGLLSAGDNYYQGTRASGAAEIGTASSGERGALRSGQLESANVDLALEFTRLIVAQRGFSANARTITVTDEILQELNNLIR